MIVDGFASLRHYADHLLPVLEALPAAHRGRLYGRVTQVAPPRRWPLSQPVIVASYADYVQVSPRPVIYVEHGSGQTYTGDEVSATASGWAGGDKMHRVVLFVCPSEGIAARWRARYPSTPTVVVGCPKLDVLHLNPPERYSPAMGRPARVAVTFHWDCPLVPETRSALPHYAQALPELAVAPGVTLIGHGHPRGWAHMERRWRRLGVVTEPDLSRVLATADVLVGDNTSALWEFASLGKPIVLLDAPWYRKEVRHGLRFWDHADAGVRIGERWMLLDAVERALCDEPDVAVRRDAAVAEVYAHTDGRASQRAATAILERMETIMRSTPRAPATRRSNERESEQDLLARRLRALGATPNEVAMMRQTWDDLDDEWTVEKRSDLVRSSDVVLAGQLEAVRAEYPWEPDHEVGSLETNPHAVVVGADSGMPDLPPPAPDPMPSIDESIPKLTAWVGSDRQRALTVIEAEQSAAALASQEPRKTLIEALTKIADGD